MDDQPDALHRRVVQHPGLSLEPVADEGAAPEGLDRADAGGALFDERREITLIVLHPPRRLGVATLENTQHEHERNRHDDDEQHEHRVQPREQDEHHERGDAVDHEEDGAPADEPADRRDVARRPREELSRVPVVVETHVEPLEVGIEVVAELRLHTVGDHPEDVAADEAREGLEDAEHQRQPGEGGDPLPVAVAQRPVDHRFRDQGDRNGGEQADECDGCDNPERAPVRTHVGQDASKTSVSHSFPPNGWHLTLRRIPEAVPGFP